jgi:ribose 5-phosphate isomerase B
VRVALGADHAGFDLKEALKLLLDQLRVPYLDFGTSSTASVDYPDYAETVARAVVDGRAEVGILVCGTGIGMSIAANKIAGVRAGLAWDAQTARLARAHNNANILTLGGRTTPVDRARDIVTVFLSTAYEDGRHDRRLEEIARLERKDAAS